MSSERILYDLVSLLFLVVIVALAAFGELLTRGKDYTNDRQIKDDRDQGIDDVESIRAELDAQIRGEK